MLVVAMEAVEVDKSVGNDDCHIWKKYADGYIVRSMRASEAHIPVKWLDYFILAKYDLSICHEIFPDGPGFYIGEYDGKIVASSMHIPWGNSLYYGSMYYVAKEYRSRGFGTRLRDQVVASHLGSNILCIDAVTGSVSEKNVKRFSYESRFLTGRFEGLSKGNYEMKMQGRMLPVREVDFNRLIDYDNTVFISRDNPQGRDLLKKFIQLHDSTSYVAVDECSNIVGYGFQRACVQEGHVIIAPLYGNSLSIAEGLLKRLLNDVKGKRFTMDLCQINESAMQLVKILEMKKICDFSRQHLNGGAKEFKKELFAMSSELCGF